MNKPRVSPHLKRRVLEAKITTLEGALLKKIRELDFGEFTVKITKVEGQPIRIEVDSIKESEILKERDGLDLDDAVYSEEEANLNID